MVGWLNIRMSGKDGLFQAQHINHVSYIASKPSPNRKVIRNGFLAKAKYHHE